MKLSYLKRESYEHNIACGSSYRLRIIFFNLPDHWQIFERAITLLAADTSVLGLYLSGSFANGKPDRWSDIDLCIVVENGRVDTILIDQQKLIDSIAPVVTKFPAIHLGNSHQIIVFYKANDPIHVDFQYKELAELEPCRHDANIKIIFDHSGAVAYYRQLCQLAKDTQILSHEKIQYLEDRFWGWCWYTYTKIMRGELWEARDALEYIRNNVLVILSHNEGQILEGNRRLETKLSKHARDVLTTTVSHEHSGEEYARILTSMMHVYIDLFDKLSSQLRSNITKVDRGYFIQAIDSVNKNAG